MDHVDRGFVLEVEEDDTYFTVSYGPKSGEKFGMTFSMKKELLPEGTVVKSGDPIEVHLHNGSTVRGVTLNGVVLYYKSDDDLDREHQQYVDDLAKKRRERFAEKRSELDAQYGSLPPHFKQRIDKFRNTGGEQWRIDFEEYEMSSCLDAIKIANVAQAVIAASGTTTPHDWIENFNKLDYEQQNRIVPDLYQGHSGNSFAFAVRLAYHALTDPVNVILEHGALTPLTGCEEYSCPHPYTIPAPIEVEGNEVSFDTHGEV